MASSFRVIIFGGWGETWMTALNPDSDVWLKLPMVKEVLVVPNADIVNIPPSENSGLYTVILPLMEWHMVQYPRHYSALVSSEKTVKTLWFKHEFDNYLSNCFFYLILPQSLIKI